MGELPKFAYSRDKISLFVQRFNVMKSITAKFLNLQYMVPPDVHTRSV